MSGFRNTILGLVAVAAVAAPGFTQQQKSPYGQPQAYDGVTLYYPQTGRMVADHLSDQDMKMAIQHGQPLNGPVMIVQSGGQAYVVQDMAKPMPDGSPMAKYFENRMSGKQ